MNLQELNLQELMGVVNIYPWFGAARRELCARMAAMGAWSEAQFAEAALYLGSRKIVAELAHESEEGRYADEDISKLVGEMMVIPDEKSREEVRKVFVVGGDYFSQKQYSEVRQSDDKNFSGFAYNPEYSGCVAEIKDSDNFEFCTEALAEVYVEQGYPEEAKKIYSKLSLRYPEKSVYFAALIGKLDNQSKS